MSNPIFTRGSIFGANQPRAPAQPRAAQQQPRAPQQPRSGNPAQMAGSIFGASSVNAGNPAQSARGGRTPRGTRGPRGARGGRTPRAPREPSGPQQQTGSIFGAQAQSQPRDKQRPASRGRGHTPGSSNPRQNLQPVNQVVGQQEFQTWNRNEVFPNTPRNQLMQRVQTAASSQEEQKSGQDYSAFMSTSRSPTKPRGRGRGDTRTRGSERPTRNLPKPSRGEPTKSRGIWRFFQKGICNKGENCEFEHKLVEPAKPANKTWSKKKEDIIKPRPTKHEDEPEDEDQELAEEDDDAQEEEEEEQEEDSYIEEEELKEQHKSTPEENPNKGKDLRMLLNRIRKDTTPESSQRGTSEIESEEDNAYNSDTFGEIRKPRVIKRLSPKAAGRRGQHDTIEEIPRMEELSDIEGISEEEKDELEIPPEDLSLPSNLIKVSNENPYIKIRSLMTE